VDYSLRPHSPAPHRRFYSRVRINMNRRSPHCSLSTRDFCISKAPSQLASGPAKLFKNRQKLLCTVFVQPTIRWKTGSSLHTEHERIVHILYTKGKSPKADTVMPVRLSPVPLDAFVKKLFHAIWLHKTTRTISPKGDIFDPVKVYSFLYQSFPGVRIDSSVFSMSCIVFFLHIRVIFRL